MKRPCLVLVLMLVAGCASRKPLAPDAFFGRTAVAPPGTGSAQAAYYTAPPRLTATQESSPATSSFAQSVARRDESVQTAVHIAEPMSASWQHGETGSGAIRTRVRPPDYARPASEPPSAAGRSVAIAKSTVTDSSGVTSGWTTQAREPFVRVLQPLATASRSTPAGATPAAAMTSWTGRSPAGGTGQDATNTPSPATPVIERAPRRIILPARVTNIGDLPDPGTRASRQYRVDPRVRLASAATVSVTPRPAAADAAPTSRSTGGWDRSGSGNTSISSPSLRYGHDPAYAWLRGRLEYSDLAKRWKLRYIPIDGQADQYGGSVVLGESTLLAEGQEGDFVEVRGRLLTGEEGHWGYAPVYQVAQLRPLGR